LDVATGQDSHDIGFSLATTRTHLQHRAVVVADDHVPGLTALANGQPHADLITGQPGSPKAVFVFPGQGAQWTGMGQDLLAASEVYAGYFEECVAALRPGIDWDPYQALNDEAMLDRVDVVQPLL